MPVTPELRAQILRYRLVELWRTGTIATQLHVHHGTVERYRKREEKACQDLAARKIAVKNGGHKKKRNDPELPARKGIKKHGKAEEHGESDLPGRGPASQ